MSCMSRVFDATPSGGCVKVTNGSFYQIFDGKGQLIAQTFVAYNSDFTDSGGLLLGPDDPRVNFYAPFTCEKELDPN